MKETKLFKLVTGAEMKPWLSRNMLLNINTRRNRWSNFSANFKVVSLKLLELTQFAWPNLSIYFIFIFISDIEIYFVLSTEVIVYFLLNCRNTWLPCFISVSLFMFQLHLITQITNWGSVICTNNHYNCTNNHHI